MSVLESAVNGIFAAVVSGALSAASILFANKRLNNKRAQEWEKRIDKLREKYEKKAEQDTDQMRKERDAERARADRLAERLMNGDKRDDGT